MSAASLQVLLLVHYPPSAGASMRCFAGLLAAGLRGRGHQVECCTAPVLLSRLAPAASVAAKWLGYLDQFLLFPPLLWLRLRRLPARSLVVVVDQALGPWVPLIRNRPHLIHVHDLLALESSLGRWPINPVGLSGRLYQRLIRWGFRQGRCLLSVSHATDQALRQHMPAPLACDHSGRHLAVLANPLSPAFRPLSADQATRGPFNPYLLHVGTTWYKNRAGLLELFAALVGQYHWPHLQLVLVGALEAPLQQRLRELSLAGRVTVLEAVNELDLVSLYQQAEALVFPSFAEGFGWPPLEALACGCPAVISSVEPLLSLCGGTASILPRFEQPGWANAAASVVAGVLRRSPAERHAWRQRGLAHTRRHESGAWLDAIEAHYTSVLVSGQLAQSPPAFPLACISGEDRP